VFTGLREGEKLHEVLVTEGEQDARPIHPKISHSQVPPTAPPELDHGTWLITINGKRVPQSKPEPSPGLTEAVKL
jgi:FlaA1/EpsC-like NDP-sugar epimerase